MNLHRLRSRTSAFIMTPEYLVTAFHLLPSTMAHLILEKKTKSKGFLEFSPVSVVFDRKTEHVSLWCSKVDAQSKRSRSRSASKRTTSAHAKVEQGTALLLFLRTATVLRLLLSH